MSKVILTRQVVYILPPAAKDMWRAAALPHNTCQCRLPNNYRSMGLAVRTLVSLC